MAISTIIQPLQLVFLLSTAVVLTVTTAVFGSFPDVFFVAMDVSYGYRELSNKMFAFLPMTRPLNSSISEWYFPSKHSRRIC